MIKLVKFVWSAVWVVLLFGVGALICEMLGMCSREAVIIDFIKNCDYEQWFAFIFQNIKKYCLIVLDVLYFGCFI